MGLRENMRILAAGIVAVALASAQAPQTRPCSEADLDGVYALVDFYDNSSNGWLKRAAEQAPYRLIAFLAPSSWGRISFNIKPSFDQAMKSIRVQANGSSIRIQANGQITLSKNGVPQYLGTCAVSLQNNDKVKENDLILVGSYAQAPSQVHELFRRWTDGQVPEAKSSFDPAPNPPALQRTQVGSEDVGEVQATMPETPIPISVKVLTSGTDAQTQVFAAVKNTYSAPLSAFLLIVNERGQPPKTLAVDACLEHHAAWQPREQWTRPAGLLTQIGNLHLDLGAAIFTDGSTWGNPKLLGKLKARRGGCQWPGT
jgi:hypothetical protein